MAEALMVTEINCTTGEVIERPFTAEEISQREADLAVVAAEQVEREAETARVEALKASARTKLVAGEPLTPEEAATIVL
jgi:hypothetical protein